MKMNKEQYIYKAKGEEFKSKGESQKAKSFIAVDFSQRNRKPDMNSGLQPHSMWLKPVTFMIPANRQLKQTAINQIYSLRLAACDLQLLSRSDFKEENSTVKQHSIYNASAPVHSNAGHEAGEPAIRACNVLLN